MVMDRSIDFTDSLDDYMEDGEVQDESAPFFSDEDLQNEFQAPTMVNPSRKAAQKFEIPWRALRLPGARTGERDLGAPARAQIASLFGRAEDIRSSPYAYVISAKTWNQYINNIDSVDIGAELNAPISEHEKASLFLFAEEWRLDVTHEAFKRRLIDHPLVNVGDETAKGQMVFDILTGAISHKGGRPDTRYQSMFRLAMDLLNSIRLRYYNFYSVNLLHQHEGSALYEEFLSRYTPLAADEVAVIQEIDMGVRAKGRQYAVETTSPLTDAITSYNLMLRVVESYAMGDTMTARAGINVLLQAPINYKSSMKFSVTTDHLGRSNLSRDGQIVVASFNYGSLKKDNQKPEKRSLHYILDESVDGSTRFSDAVDSNKANIIKAKLQDGQSYIEVNSISDPTPKNIITVNTSGEGALNRQDYASFVQLGPAAERRVEQATNTGQEQRRGRRNNVRTNPVLPNMAFNITEEMSAIGEEARRQQELELERYRDDVKKWDKQYFENIVREAVADAFRRGHDNFTIELSASVMSQPAGHEAAFHNLAGVVAGRDLDVLGEILSVMYGPDYQVIVTGDKERPDGGIGPGVWSYQFDFKKRKGRDGARTNPVGVGQGQHFFIQLKPKSQFSFTKQQKKMGSTSKGTMTVVGTPGRDSTGLGDIFGGFEASGYVAWKGTHKDSGSKEAWIIQLPRKYGKGKKRGKGGNVVFKKARVTDKDTGRSYSTIRPFGADPAIKAAWAKFLKTYGEPIFAEDPKRPNLFRIRRKNRGSHYKRK